MRDKHIGMANGFTTLRGYINNIARRAGVANNGSLKDILTNPETGRRKARTECRDCGGKMFSYQNSLCYSCIGKKIQHAQGKTARKIEAGNAILAIEKRKAEIKAAQRAKK